MHRSRYRYRSPQRRSGLESLEARRLLTGLPFGAAADDTGEYMLGDVLVTAVLLESDGSLDEPSQQISVGQTIESDSVEFVSLSVSFSESDSVALEPLSGSGSGLGYSQDPSSSSAF